MVVSTDRFWHEVAQDNFDASGELMAGKRYRSCVNRAYYAAFARVTEELIIEGMSPRKDMGTWSHDTLPSILRNMNPRYSSVSWPLERLYKLRLYADYDPVTRTSNPDAREALGLMGTIFRRLKQAEK